MHLHKFVHDPIQRQADRYAEHIKTQGMRVIALHPRRKSMAANANKARFHILKALTEINIGERVTDEALDRLEVEAKARGYDIVEVMPKDYVRKLYAHELVAEA